MLKKAGVLSALCSLALVTGISANWLTGNETVLAVSQGEAAFQTSLSSDQKLAMNLTASDTATADLVFSTKASSSVLTLSSLPVQVSTDGHQDAKVTVTQLVNDGNGLRFYIIDTGNAESASIVSYKRGNFATAFSAASLNTSSRASFEVNKKEILFHAGDATSGLTLNAKDGTFTAVKK